MQKNKTVNIEFTHDELKHSINDTYGCTGKCKYEEVNRLQEDITAVIYQENEKAFAENLDAVCASTEYLGDKIAEQLYKLGYRRIKALDK